VKASEPSIMAFLASLRPDATSKAVVSFDRTKAFYIFTLVAFHQVFLKAPSHSVQISQHLPYETVDHGVEMMMGMSLISGWLSSSTWKNISWKEHMTKKVARLIPAYIVAVAITGISLMMRGTWVRVFHFALDCVTLGGWNPYLIWWSCNRPLWFISTLLTYHYLSPPFLRWTRRRSVVELAASLLLLYLTRLALACSVLVFLAGRPGGLQENARVIHVWSPTQIWIPFMGAILEQLVANLQVPSSTKRWHVWLASDLLLLILIAFTLFVPQTGTPLADALIAYANLITGPLLLALVALMSCDSNSFRKLTSITEGSCRLFSNMLKLSYTLYLTHWPIAEILHDAGFFDEDSWDCMLGTTLVSILLALCCDTIVVEPFTKFFCSLVSPKRPPADPEKGTIAKIGKADGGAPSDTAGVVLEVECVSPKSTDALQGGASFCSTPTSSSLQSLPFSFMTCFSARNP